MSITLYSKFRRQNLRRAWEYAHMTKWCVDVAGKLLLWIAALILVQYVTDRAIAEDLAMKCGMYIDFFGGFVGASTGEERRFTPHNHAECCEAIVLAAAEMERSKGK